MQQNTEQFQEYEAWRHHSLLLNTNAINLDGSEDISVLPHSLNHVTDVTDVMLQSDSQSSDNSITQPANKFEIAKALLNEDRQKSVTYHNQHAIKQNSTSSLNYLLEDVNNRISDLIEDCSEKNVYSNIQLVIFQVVSAIRSVLLVANTVEKTSPLLKTFPALAKQRRGVLEALSKLVLKGKELDALSYDMTNGTTRQKVQHDIPTLANQLILEIGLFENLLRSVFESTQFYYLNNNEEDEEDEDDSSDDNDNNDSSENNNHSNGNQSIDFHSSPNNLLQKLNDYNNTSNTLCSFDSVSSLRQQLVGTHISSEHLIANAVPDSQQIIKTILDHQLTIEKLIGALVIAVEHFLGSKQRATEMLVMTRKAVEAVRTFLTVVEHVCSNVGDIDYRHYSMIPEDPHLVALVLAKEAVYTSITNLVTAVRTLTGPKDEDSNMEDELYHLQISCDAVIKTSSECVSCVRACICDDNNSNHNHNYGNTSLDSFSKFNEETQLLEMRHRLEDSVDSRRNQTLSILGRKATSLNVLQQKYEYEYNDYNGDNGNNGNNQPLISTVINSETENYYSTPPKLEKPLPVISSINNNNNNNNNSNNNNNNNNNNNSNGIDRNINENNYNSTNNSNNKNENIIKNNDNHQLISENDYNRSFEEDVNNLEIKRQPTLSSSEPSSSAAVDVLEGYTRHCTKNTSSMLSDGGQSQFSFGNKSTRSYHSKVSRSDTTSSLRRSHATARSSTTTTATFSSGMNSRPFSDQCSVDTYNMTPLTTPEAMSPVNEYDDDIPIGQQLPPVKIEPAPKTRNRSSSIGALARQSIINHRTSSASLSSTTNNNINNNNMNPITTLPPSLPLSSSQRLPLPPVPASPMDPPSDLIISSSKSTPAIDQPTASSAAPIAAKTRRPRGMSVNALRLSIKQRYDDHRNSNASLPKESVEPVKSINRTSSRSSIASSNNSLNDSKYNLEPWFLKQRVFSEDEIIYNADGLITGASIEALIENFTLHKKAPDHIFTRAFLSNFRLFITPTKFVDLLIQRYHLAPPSEPELCDEDLDLWRTNVLALVRVRVFNLIKIWLEKYFHPEQDDVVESQLYTFATEDVQQCSPEFAPRLIKLIRQSFANSGSSISNGKMGMNKNFTNSHLSGLYGTNNGSNVSLNEMQPARPPLYSKNSSSHLSVSSSSTLHIDFSIFGSDNSSFSSSSTLNDQYGFPPINFTRSLRNNIRKALSQNSVHMVHINDFDCLELARQFTLMESALFCQIKPYEMVGQEFKKKLGQSAAIHVKAMIQKSTQITSWITDTILREGDAKRRSQMIKFWIKVADCCLQLNNYNTLMAIRSALDSTSIRRLKKSWDHLSSKYTTILEPIYKSTDSLRNFAEYRTRLKSSVAPCLPFLGVYLTDMTFIDDGNNDLRYTPSGIPLINFDKYIKTTKVLSAIHEFQIPYKLLEVEDIQRFLTLCLESVDRDDQAFYERSLKLEPREEETNHDHRITFSHFT
ncbi:unnamed protein product [Cunninghamella blakesleeana]